MSEKKISVSWKPGTGYESPLINVQGDSAAEVDHNLRELIQSGTLTRVLQSAVNSQQEYVALKRGSAPEEQHQPPQQDQQYAPPPQQGAQQGWGQQPQQQYQQPPQQGAQQGWGQPVQQNAAPGGAPVCKCGQIMEHKTTTGGKPVWRCKDWKWNNGNPTPNHDQIWVEGSH